MTKALSIAQAADFLGVSRHIFDMNIRPELTEKKYGARTVRFDLVELEDFRKHPDGMFRRRTVADALDHAWESQWKTAKGRAKKESLKNKVLAEIGEVRLSRLDYNRIEQWVRELRDSDRAVATIKSRLSCLNYALRLAVKKGWLDTIPPMPDLEQSARKLRYLRDEPDEERMLLRCCPVLGPDASRVMSHAIVFLLDTGCRLSELLKVRYGSISEIRGTTYVLFEDRKAGDNLRLPLTSRAREAIEALLNDRYWMRRVRGADLDEKRCRSAQNWMTHGFARVRDDARLPDVSLHTLRHTCASRLVQAGVNLYEIRKMLGHSSITVTERYSHLAPDGLAGVVSVLEARGLPRKVTSIKMRTPSQ